MLSQLIPTQIELHEVVPRWCFGKRLVKPFPQVSIDKQVHSKKVNQIGERPSESSFHLEVLNQQHRNHGRPNLSPDRIGGRADEAFDSKILFQHLKEGFDLPPILIDLADRGGGQPHLVR